MSAISQGLNHVGSFLSTRASRAASAIRSCFSCCTKPVQNTDDMPLTNIQNPQTTPSLSRRLSQALAHEPQPSTSSSSGVTSKPVDNEIRLSPELKAGAFVAKGQQAVVYKDEMNSNMLIRVIPSIHSAAELEANASDSTSSLGRISVELAAFKQIYGDDSVNLTLFDVNGNNEGVQQLAADADGRLGAMSTNSLIVMQILKVPGESVRDLTRRNELLPDDIIPRMQREAWRLFDAGIYVDAGLGNFIFDPKTSDLKLIDFQGFLPSSATERAAAKVALEKQLKIAEKEVVNNQSKFETTKL